MTIEHNRTTPAAIVGIGCLFAKSEDQKAFLHLISKGVDGISDPPETHAHLNAYLDPDPKKPDHIYCQRGGFIPPTAFDPTEFSIPPNVIEATDTSQLLGLVTAKRALEDAGYGENGKAFDRSKASVIIGVTGTQELVIPLGARLGHPVWRSALEEAGVPEEQAADVIQRISDGYVQWQENSFPGLLGNVVAGRIANRLDLGGTNCVVDAACASSMGAIHMALLELESGRSDMVLTGGADTINDAFMHMCFSKTQILSPTGDIRPFSKEADGTILGEGIGIVVLKRLADAERDGDRIYAVIKGLGSASDGRSQSIYAPRSQGQAAALQRAYRSADVDPTHVRLVEAHGTGTRVGDQVEFEALCDVFGATSPNGNRCALGSIKSNIGHTKAAAGTAGLIKTALSIYHKILPPTLKVSEPDPKLGLRESPFYLNTQTRPWIESPDVPRTAGVSAFGFGGSNFHAVLQEHVPVKLEPSWDGTVEMAAFSADDTQQLQRTANGWMKAVLDHPTRHTIGRHCRKSRSDFKRTQAHRLVMVIDLSEGDDHLRLLFDQARTMLRDRQTGLKGSIYLHNGSTPGTLAMLFPGQGSQYVGMGRDVICCFPESLAAFQEACSKFPGATGLEEYIFPRNVDQPTAAEASLRQTDVAQPAIGAVSTAMLAALTRFGVAPDAVAGHSYGELTAMRAANWYSADAFWRLTLQRGRLMADAGQQSGDCGTMLAVKAPLDAIAQLVDSLDHDVVLANRNSRDQGVLSGSTAGIDAARSACRNKGWHTIDLPVAAAFHSPRVAAAQRPFSQIVEEIEFTPGAVAVMSNTLGSAYPNQTVAIRDALSRQLASPVHFLDNMEQLYADGVRVFVEVGPKSVLSQLVRSSLNDGTVVTLAMDQSAGKGSGVVDFAHLLGKLAALGYPVDLSLWEKPGSTLRKSRMTIPLSGSNYRAPRPEAAPNAARKQKPRQTRDDRQATSETAAVASQRPTPTPPKQTAGPIPAPIASEGLNDATPHPNRIAASDNLSKKQAPVASQPAFDAVQQGLASIQALQAQTVQAHEKFLETQAQASRTMQEMIQSIRHIAAGKLEVPHVQPTPSPAGMSAPQVAKQPPSDDPTAAGPDAAVHSAPTGALQPVPAIPDAAGSAAPADDAPIVSQTLVEIVSTLTGYPAEMLGMDMDIESDLGIDSIKRVEILSALEEKMPQLPKVTPDMMGTLKTLGQICDYLAAAGPDAAVHSAPTGALQPVPAIPDAAGSAAPADDAPIVSQTLVEIVSTLTGYPAEMLGMDMDIESDLGIDSIKRVEILSALEEKMPQLPKVTPDMMGTLKTLGQICDYLSDRQSPSDDGSGADRSTRDSGPSLQLVQSDMPAAINRQRIVPYDAPLAEVQYINAHFYKIGIVTPDPHRYAALEQTLITAGHQCFQLKSQRDLKDSTALSGLIIMSSVSASQAFEWAKAAQPLLHAAAQRDAAFLMTVAFMDGSFGFGSGRVENIDQGALAGLAKTAAIEWPDVSCRALDVNPAWSDDAAIARCIANEVAAIAEAGPMEIGLDANRRIALERVDCPVPGDAPLDIKPTDTIVITGGARGVTAAAAEALAQKAQCRLALLGRSPRPEQEPAWLDGIHSDSAMKKAILNNEFSGTVAHPRELENRFRFWSANREILNTLAQLSAAGATPHYYQADICDQDQLAAALNTIHGKMGPVRGLIHGAGILQDRLIVDKSLAQFNAVYDTKVRGLANCLNLIDPNTLKWIVLFSSISARMGNQGQVDYAMANEVLNKRAQQLARTHRHCKVVSINWGPWDGGMVTPSLKRNFEENGIALIPLQAGADAMVAELGQPNDCDVEIVLGAPLPSASKHIQPDAIPAEDLSVMSTLDIDVNGYPVLKSHRLDGRPVVPLALMTEWMAHSALHANPGLYLHGIDDLRVLNGISIDKRRELISMMAGPAVRMENHYEIPVEIRNSANRNTVPTVHAKATVLLADVIQTPPVFTENGHFNKQPHHLSLDAIYQDVLFHGHQLHGIEEIIRLSKAGISARLDAAPPPAQWMKNPMRSRWLADPLVLDCAFQMAIVWCKEVLGKVSLPSFAAAYRQYSQRFPSDGVTAVFEVLETSDRKISGNFTFLDNDKRVVATLTGYEAIMDPLLVKAFKAA